MPNDTFASPFVGFYWRIKGDIWVQFIQKYTQNAVLNATSDKSMF